MVALTVVERFWAKVDRSGDCWLWTAALVNKDSATHGGYGNFWNGDRNVLAHRYAYESEVGPIPEGHQLDHRHTCPKRCVRPDHLRPTTDKQNKENQAGCYANSTSGVRGVRWHQNRWVAATSHHGKYIYVGRYRTIEEAEAAVIAKRIELHTHNDMDRVAF